MPFYLYECSECHYEEELVMTISEMEEFEKCDNRHTVCNAPMQRVFAPRRHVLFHEEVYENIAHDPIHISTAQQLQDACRKNDVSSKYMRDFGASLFRVKEGRWV